MIDRPPIADTFANRARHRGRVIGGIVVHAAWERIQRYGAVGPNSPKARGFGAFGAGSIICFPWDSIVNEYAISIGRDSIVNKGAVIAAGWGPGHAGLAPDTLSIGDRCLIGRESSLVAHSSIVIEDDVWTGQQVHITDMNHGYVILDQPISKQSEPDAPVRVGAGSWLGHHVVVLPGVTIGRHVAVGAGSIVTRDLPDFCVAVGAPARVVRRYLPDDGWVDVDPSGEIRARTQDGVAGLANLLGDLDASERAELALSKAIEQEIDDDLHAIELEAELD